jgi:hypothetical protein
MYQNEHDELFAAIRKGEADQRRRVHVHSTLMALMGRLSAYTGQALTWEQACELAGEPAADELHLGPERVPPVRGRARTSS